jgi:hypothetical protein
MILRHRLHPGTAEEFGAEEIERFIAVPEARFEYGKAIFCSWRCGVLMRRERGSSMWMGVLPTPLPLRNSSLHANWEADGVAGRCPTRTTL